MHTPDAAEIIITVPEEQYPLELHDELHHGELIDNAHPVYPAGKGFYIWYKDSVPDEIDTSIISDEYELLYQSVNLTAYKSKLNMYVSVYSACLTIVMLILISSPFLPDALATFQANKSAGINKNVVNNVTEINPVTETKRSVETVEGMPRNSIGFTDLKNNVMYVVLENGKYSIQESSWNNEEKANSRISRLNSLGVRNPAGKVLKAVIEKADLSDKGVWFRTRLGEFSTIKEAIETAAQIRAEERSKKFADLYIFPGSNLKV
ncbi:MAG: SPOR domain-containing protein [Ignavibacteria bacterium]